MPRIHFARFREHVDVNGRLQMLRTRDIVGSCNCFNPGVKIGCAIKGKHLRPFLVDVLASDYLIAEFCPSWATRFIYGASISPPQPNSLRAPFRAGSFQQHALCNHVTVLLEMPDESRWSG